MRLLRTYHQRSSKQTFPYYLVWLICLFSLGSVDLATVEKVIVQITDEEKARQQRMDARPSLDAILNLHDFEVSDRRLPFFYTL